MATALLFAALVSLCHAQTPSENQARYYVYGAFLTHAVPEIMGSRVTLGPELEQRLGVASGADRLRIYDALMSYTDGKPLSVRRATADEIAKYQPQAKRDLKQPVFRVQAGDISLLVEYDMQAQTIPFVGQMIAYQPPVAAPPPAPAPRAAPSVATPAPKPTPPVATVAPKPAPPVAAIAPKPAPAKPQPAPASAPRETLLPNGPCVVQPVMTEQDLVNCRAAPGGAARLQPGPPVVVKPQARAQPAPPPPPPQRTGPCEVKPVMTEEDLANCRNVPAGAARIDPGPPPPAARPATVARPVEPKPAAAPCVIRPVMSEEDRIACGMR